MKIAVNAKLLNQSARDGISLYVWNICRYLVKVGASHQFHFVSERPLGEEFLKPPHSNSVFKSYLFNSRLNTAFFSRLGFSKAFKASNSDLAFIPWVVPFSVQPAVVTVHDLIPICSISKEVDEFHHKIFSKANFYLFAKIYAKKAAMLIADSENTKKSIIECCQIAPEKIRVVPLGVDFAHFSPRSEEEVLCIKAKYKISGPYFINIASEWQPRKNLDNLLRGFALVSKIYPETRLVITGKRGPSYPKMVEILSKFNLSEKVLLLEFVPYQDLPSLLSGAESLVFPSLHEGFGLPVLEAMSCGCPVICSDRGALPEVGGNAALYVDPLEPASIGSMMQSLFEAPQMKANLKRLSLEHVQQFSWERTAKMTLEAFEDVFSAFH